MTDRKISKAANFIRVGAVIQFSIVGIALIRPLSHFLNRCFLALDSVPLRESISYAVLLWIIGSPVIATMLYTKLPLEQKSGSDGLLLLFWWITLFAMIIIALSLGAA